MAEIEATKLAIDMVASGTTPYRAAKECGIALNTIYRALARRRKKDAAEAQAKLPVKTKTKKDTSSDLVVSDFGGVQETLIAEWKLVRKAKRAGPITDTVIKSMLREAAKAGITLSDAVQICVERGWQGFRAEYIKSSGKANAVDSFLRQELGGGVIDVTPKVNGIK